MTHVFLPHQAIVGDSQVPITYGRDTALFFLQEAGVVGAGGAGFPAYAKYRRAAKTLLVNGAESEPGFYANKLLMRDEPEAFADVFVWLERTFGISRTVVAAEEVARPYLADLERLAAASGRFEVKFFPTEYKYGQEKALCRVALGLDIPAHDIPAQHDVIVNNVETLYDVYRAIFEQQPVLTKLLQVYGEARPLKVYEVPIGTLAADLLRIHGVEPETLAHCSLYDGGPILADLAAKPMGPEPLYAVRRTTNALLVVAPDKEHPRKKFYPEPSYDGNRIDAPWAPDTILDIEDRIDRVRVPRTGRFVETGPPCVKVGDGVERGEVLAHATEGQSIPIHASIPGRVTGIEAEYIEIHRD